ncbi:MAG: ATPase domain-containing protein [Candidatus Micrarchaeota archaeon]
MATEKVKTGIPGMDALLYGGIPKKSIVLLSGAAGSGKSIFGMQFIAEGAEQFNEKGVFITFEQDKETIIEQAKLFGWDFEALEKKGLVMLVKAYDPPKMEMLIERVEEKVIRIDRVFSRIEDTLNKFGAQRVVLDSITSLSMILPPHINSVEKKGIVASLFNRLREMGVTAMITSELARGEEKWLSRDHISEFLADGIVIVKATTMGSTLNRTIEVAKLRRSKMIGALHNFEIIDKKGIIVEKPEGIK